MLKLVRAASAVILLATLAACGGGSSATGPTAVAPTPPPSPTYQVSAALTDSYRGNWHDFVVLTWNMQNNNNVGATITALHFWIRGVDGSESTRTPYQGFQFGAGESYRDTLTFTSFAAARPLTACVIIAGRVNGGDDFRKETCLTPQ